MHVNYPVRYSYFQNAEPVFSLAKEWHERLWCDGRIVQVDGLNEWAVSSYGVDCHGTDTRAPTSCITVK